MIADIPEFFLRLKVMAMSCIAFFFYAILDDSLLFSIAIIRVAQIALHLTGHLVS